MAGTAQAILSDKLLGGMATFNIQHGFVEALVRGMRSSFLQDSDYHHLTQCDNLEVRIRWCCPAVLPTGWFSSHFSSPNTNPDLF